MEPADVRKPSLRVVKTGKLTANHDYKHQTRARDWCCADGRECGKENNDDVVGCVQRDTLGRGQKHNNDREVDGCSVHINQTTQWDSELGDSDRHTLRQHTADSNRQRRST